MLFVLFISIILVHTFVFSTAVFCCNEFFQMSYCWPSSTTTMTTTSTTAVCTTSSRRTVGNAAPISLLVRSLRAYVHDRRVIPYRCSMVSSQAISFPLTLYTIIF